MSICSLLLIVHHFVFFLLLNIFIHFKFKKKRKKECKSFVKNLLLKKKKKKRRNLPAFHHLFLFLGSWIQPYLLFAKTFFQFLFRISLVAIQKVRKPNAISVWFTAELYFIFGVLCIKSCPITWKVANQFKREKTNFFWKQMDGVWVKEKRKEKHEKFDMIQESREWKYFLWHWMKCLNVELWT